MPRILSAIASRNSPRRSLMNWRTFSRASAFASVDGHFIPLGRPAPGRLPPILFAIVFQVFSLLPSLQKDESFVRGSELVRKMIVERLPGIITSQLDNAEGLRHLM